MTEWYMAAAVALVAVVVAWAINNYWRTRCGIIQDSRDSWKRLAKDEGVRADQNFDSFARTQEHKEMYRRRVVSALDYIAASEQADPVVRQEVMRILRGEVVR